MEKEIKDYGEILSSIRKNVYDYLKKYNIKGLVIGVSGGLDSGVNCAILRPICDELGIPLIGRFIQIESNKKSESDKADAIGKAFCTDYKTIDLTELYKLSLPYYEENKEYVDSFSEKIRRGNIKARMRMIHLYNLAQTNSSIVVDNDNLTEHLLGFWTLNGDVGDITPLAFLYKTQVYQLTKYIIEHDIPQNEEYNEHRLALQGVYDAVPTDGLGITSSDVEQLGAKSYDEVDDILINVIPLYRKVMLYPKTDKAFEFDAFELEETIMIYKEKYGDALDKVIKRHLNSEFKRNHPYKFII